MTNQREPILPLTRYLLPNASEEELREATERIYRFCTVLYQIYMRIEEERNAALLRDKSGDGGSLELPVTQKEI